MERLWICRSDCVTVSATKATMTYSMAELPPLSLSTTLITNGTDRRSESGVPNDQGTADLTICISQVPVTPIEFSLLGLNSVGGKRYGIVREWFYNVAVLQSLLRTEGRGNSTVQ